MRYTFTAWMSEFPEENAEMLARAINRLGLERESGDLDTMVRISRLPDDAKQGDILNPLEWIQTAGTARRLTVEVKRLEKDGIHRQYVVGRRGAVSETAKSENIKFGDYHVSVRPSEVLDAAEAISLFQYYYDHHLVPSGWHMRELSEYAQDGEGELLSDDITT